MLRECFCFHPMKITAILRSCFIGTNTRLVLTEHDLVSKLINMLSSEKKNLQYNKSLGSHLLYQTAIIFLSKVQILYIRYDMLIYVVYVVSPSTESINDLRR